MKRRFSLALLSGIILASLVISGCFLISVDASLALSIDIEATAYAYDATFDFGPVDPAAGPATVTVGIVNVAERDVTVTDLSVSNVVFAIETPALPATVASGESIEVSLSFDPGDSDDFAGILSVTIDRADLPFVLNLSGEGNYPPVANAVVVVSGAGTDEVNGTYYRTDEIEDGCPVYRLTGTEYRIYRYSITEVTDWFIDDDFVSSSAHYVNGAYTFTAPNGVPNDDWGLGTNGVDNPPSSVGEIRSSLGSVDRLTEDDEISPNYLYSDAEDDIEGVTLYQWYRSDTPMGAYSPIEDETSSSYTVVLADNGYYFKVLVTPLATDGITTGEPVWFGPSPQLSIPM